MAFPFPTFAKYNKSTQPFFSIKFHVYCPLNGRFVIIFNNPQKKEKKKEKVVNQQQKIRKKLQKESHTFQRGKINPT